MSDTPSGGSGLRVPETVREGSMDARIHTLDDGKFVVADQAGWLPGVFDSRDAALNSARAANGLKH